MSRYNSRINLEPVPLANLSTSIISDQNISVVGKETVPYDAEDGSSKSNQIDFTYSPKGFGVQDLYRPTSRANIDDLTI